jgi:predicted small integral membrane protein
MEFIPQFFNNSRTLLVAGFVVWGMVAYGISRRMKRLPVAANRRDRA